MKESESRSVVSNSLRPHGLYSPWNSPGQNTGVGSLSLLQGDLPNPGIKPRSPALQTDSLLAEPQGKPNYIYTHPEYKHQECVFSDIHSLDPSRTQLPADPLKQQLPIKLPHVLLPLTGLFSPHPYFLFTLIYPDVSF